MDLRIPYDVIPPNYHVCDPAYGSGLLPADCFAAAEGLPQGSETTTYLLNSPEADTFTIPNMIHSGACYISIEAAGPSLPSTLRIAPNDLRAMAGLVLQRCVLGAGIGGFGTVGINGLIEYILDPSTDYNNPSYRPDTCFVTVAVTGLPGRLFSPGNTDPAVPLGLAWYNTKIADMAPLRSATSLHRSANAAYWIIKAAGMQRGSPVSWNRQVSESSDKMTYDCDPGLGSPLAVDCAQVEWQKLGQASETIIVGPEKVVFLHSNTCYLAVTASVALVLTWEQIRTALSTLMAICIQHPFHAPQGGRARFRSQPRQICSHRRKRMDPITGLNALPPHANITVFEQTEPWSNPVDELNTCTWKSISAGLSISKCTTA